VDKIAEMQERLLRLFVFRHPLCGGGYMDRERLWNSVEGSEKRFDAQYARKIVAALPREIPKEGYERKGIQGKIL